ncbi:FkbM family methyltransferase [Microseira sp. BLCC-F43]|uniref:FkbM family methyltransferase n=1 Tax=Microseira sp. BLCC-F43 TaxID=3153602 RepID=UPI0035B84C81
MAVFLTLVMQLLKSVIRDTPLEPVARRVYRSLAFTDQNAIYDRQTIQVLKHHLKDDSVCIDIGTHRGEILLEMMTIAPRGRHFAFEPIAHLAASLRRRFPQTHIYELALSHRCGEIEFQYVVNDPGYSGIQRRIYHLPEPQIQTIVVQTNRLDNIIPPDVPVSFIKIDIEGAEYLAMCGGVETIKRNRPIIVFEAGKESTSCYGINPEQIFDFLENECQLRVSTMKRWLQGESSFSRKQFCEHFNQALDYYFIAYPSS